MAVLVIVGRVFQKDALKKDSFCLRTRKIKLGVKLHQRSRNLGPGFTAWNVGLRTLFYKYIIINIPYAREKTDLLNRPTSQKWIIETDSLSCQTHTFMLFLDALAQEKYI